MANSLLSKVNCEPWNKGRIIGQKLPLKLKEIWAIRIRLQLAGEIRDLALFNLAIDSKLRACDLVRLRVLDVTQANQVAHRAIIMQRKTKRPVQIEITDQASSAVGGWIGFKGLETHDYLFPSRQNLSTHISTRQYAKMLRDWVADIGLDPKCYGTHSLRQTKATLICRRTKNLRAVQLLLGHSKVESTVCYLGIELDDALEIAEQTEVRFKLAESGSEWQLLADCCWSQHRNFHESSGSLLVFSSHTPGVLFSNTMDWNRPRLCENPNSEIQSGKSKSIQGVSIRHVEFMGLIKRYIQVMYWVLSQYP